MKKEELSTEQMYREFIIRNINSTHSNKHPQKIYSFTKHLIDGDKRISTQGGAVNE